MESTARIYKYRVQDDLPALREADDEFNEAVSRLEDFLLTVVAGIPPALATDDESRRLVALSYLKVESSDDPLCSFRGDRVFAEDPVEALREILAEAGLDGAEIDRWARAARRPLSVPPGDASRWVNRRAMFERDLAGAVEQEVVWDLIDELHPRFLARSADADADRADVGGGKRPASEYNKSGRSLVSRIFGSGSKKDLAAEMEIAAATLRYLDDLKEDEVPTSAEALPVILELAGIEGDDFPATCLVGKPPFMTEVLRFHKLDAATREEKAASREGPWDVRFRRRLAEACRSKIERSRKQMRQDFSWLRPLRDELFPDIPSNTAARSLPLIAALTSVFSHHTKISNQETQRAKVVVEVAEAAAALEDHAEAVACLDAYVATRREEIRERRGDEKATYSIRPKAVTGWPALRKEYEQVSSAEERLAIAKTLPYRLGSVKTGDHRLFEFLATDAAAEAGCWAAVTSYVRWHQKSATAANTRVPRFQHKTETRARASMAWGNNAWTIHIDEDPEGKHTATVHLFNDPRRKHTVRIRNARADRELLVGSDEEQTAVGRHGSLGGPRPGERPITGQGRGGRATPLSKQSWTLRYENDLPYLCHAAKLVPVKPYAKHDEHATVVGVDRGLRNCMAYAVALYVPDAEEIIERNRDTLVAHTAFDRESGAEVVIAYQGEADGREVVLRREGRGPYRWVKFVKFGAIRAQGRRNRKASREEHAFAVSLRKRSHSRLPVKKHVKGSQRAAVDSLRRLVSAQGHVVRTVVALRDPDRRDQALDAWRGVALRGNDYKTRNAARDAWVRTFGVPPSPDAPPLRPPSRRRLVEAADAIEDAWRESDEEIDALVSEVEQWIAPRGAGAEARMTGGLHEDRLETIRKLLAVMRAWEGRPTPENPKKTYFRGEYPPRLRRVDDYLQRKKKEQQKQAAAALFKEVRPYDPDAMFVERLDGMKGDQTRSRRRNRQGARMAPAQSRQILEERAQLEGVKLRDASAAMTSQVDWHTGKPGLRVRMVAVEEFVHSVEFFRKLCSGHRDQTVRKQSVALVDALYEQWCPETKTWTDDRGAWRLASRVPSVRWDGPGEHPRHVLVPDGNGSIFLSARGGKLRQMDADMNAAANIALSGMAWPWRQTFPEGQWVRETRSAQLEVLELLRARELHATSQVEGPGPRVQKPPRDLVAPEKPTVPTPGSGRPANL